VAHTRKLLPVGIVALLLLSMVMLAMPTSAGKPAPPGGGVLWLEPEFVNCSEVGLGNTFKVELWANISTTAGVPADPGCFAYGYWFDWDDTLINLTSYSVYPPTDIWGSNIFVVVDLLKDMDGNTKYDRHSYAVTALGEPPGWKDGRMIAEYTFKVTNDSVVTQSLFVITNNGFTDTNGYSIPITIIPEFPVSLIIFLFVVTTLAAAVLGKKAWLRKLL